MKINIKLLITILAVISLSHDIFAQPGEPPDVALWRVYDYGIAQEDWFYDVYATADHGLIMCGASHNRDEHSVAALVARIDEDYEDIWAHHYQLGYYQTYAYSVIETDDSDFLLGGAKVAGHLQRPEFFALLIDNDGERIWDRQYVRGQPGGMCQAVLELKNGGNFILAGFANDMDDGYVVCIEPDGDVVWDFVYPNSYLYTMRETIDGIVLAGYFLGENPNCTVILKIDFNGELLWDEFPDIGGRDGRPDCARSMVSSPEGGFAVAGYCYVDYERAINDRVPYLLKIDRNGQREWVSHYDVVHPENGYAVGLAKLNDGGGYILAGTKKENNNGVIIDVMQAIRVTSRGIIRWHNLMPEGEVLNLPQFRAVLSAVIVDENNCMLAVGSSHVDDEIDNNLNNQVAVLVKLEPDDVPTPYVIFLPADSLQSLLMGDSITFSAEPVNFQGYEIEYLWALDGDTLAFNDRTDSMTVPFPDCSEYEMYGAVFAEDILAGEKTWQVSALEFYIVDFRPDSTEMTIRRSSSVDFAIDVRAVDFEGLGYCWDLIDRNGMHQEISDADTATVLFDLSGDYDVEGVVWRGDNFDMARWAVTVRSAVWDWYPKEPTLTVPYDTTMDFEIIPFNPASDSLGYFWTMNDDPLDVDTTVSQVTIEFPFINQEIVRCIVHDGCEADTVTWLIDVIDPRGVTHDPDDLLPESVSLSTPFPNPFNAVTRIAYAVPSASHVKLAVYDITGRMVGLLVNGNVSAGHHVCEFDGGELAAGLYFISLEVGGDVLTRKAVVVK